MTPMTTTEAVRYLHERHSDLVDDPADGVSLETLHLEFLWFQMQVCDWADGRKNRRVRRCLKSMSHLWMLGDRDVRLAVLNDFFMPHLFHHPDLPWIRARMDEPLLDAYRMVCRANQEIAGK